jgi:hypothetical protein
MMRMSSKIVPAVIALAIALPLAGCGDGNNDNIFIGDEPTPTPANGRTSTPVRTPTPGAAPTETTVAETATPTAVATNGEPTVTPTPSGVACNAGDQIVVVASLDKTYGAARVDLASPGSVNIPGTGPSQDVASRVDFGPTGGITTVNDSDTNSDATDDTLTASFLSSSVNAPGTFVTVTFDCIAGQPAPASGEFTCTVVSASTGGGTPITDEQCSLNDTGP